MIPIHRPSITVDVVYDTCVAEIRDVASRHRHTAVRAQIVQSESDYLSAVRTGTADCFPSKSEVRAGADAVTGDELVSLYTRHLANKRSAARRYYDALMLGPPNGICPYCAQRLVSVLDHYLPKSSFPDLAVTPTNLVPVCQDCNKAKLDAVACTAEELFVHPYFDDVNEHEWLSAKVQQTVPLVVLFSVQRPHSWPAVLCDRVEWQFKRLGLARLYAAHAAEELQNIRTHVDRILQSAGAIGVRAHLAEQAMSYASHRRNGWQAAMYRALAASQRFCSGLDR